jgi:hypothetical protein
MSDVLDVADVLCQQIFAAVYPSVNFDESGYTFDSKENFDQTSTSPVAVNKFDTGVQFNTGAQFDATKSPSITGTPIVIYPGWPQEDNLATDLANGKTHISVFPSAQERNTTRYPEREQVVAPPSPTLTLAISGPGLVPGQKFFDAPGVTWDSGGNYDTGLQNSFVVTVGGAVSVPQNVALRINGKFYVYGVQSGDTPASIASALAALVAADVAGTSVSGAVIAIGPLGRLQAARVGGFGTIAKEIRRQERVMTITVWANAPALRDQITAAVDAALAETRFLTMPDGFGARLIYKNSMVIDAQQKAGLYRRSLNYTVEYATTFTKQRAAVIAPSVGIGSNFNSISVTA